MQKYQTTSNKAVFQKTDVTSWSDLDAMFSATMQHFGSVDIVCPGAGVFEPQWSNFWYPPGTVKSKDDAAGGRYKLLDINLTHPIRVTQMAISHFLAADPPSSAENPKSIVHIASMAAETASLPIPLYHASKHGLQALVRSLADLEGLCGIRITCLMPGVVKTPLWLENPDKMQIVKQDGENPDVWVTPEEVAHVMLACVKDNEVSSVFEGSLNTNGSSEKEMIQIKGGSCLEVLAGTVRDVPMWGNVGPYASGSPGSSVGDAEKAYKEVMRELKPGWGRT